MILRISIMGTSNGEQDDSAVLQMGLLLNPNTEIRRTSLSEVRKDLILPPDRSYQNVFLCMMEDVDLKNADAHTVRQLYNTLETLQVWRRENIVDKLIALLPRGASERHSRAARLL